MLAVFACFGPEQYLRKKRPGASVDGSMVLQPFMRKCQEMKLGVMPRLMHQICEDAITPNECDDTAARSTPYETDANAAPIPVFTSEWNIEYFERMTANFPNPTVRRYGFEVMKGTLDTFVGDRTKTVRLKAPDLDEDVAQVLRKKCLDNVKVGFVAGPYTTPPDANTRVCNIFGVPKNPRDPKCEKIRMISHYSESAPPNAPRSKFGSINALYYCPRYMASYLTASWLFNMIAWFGPGTIMDWGDVPHAFKRNMNNPDLRFLSVSQLKTKSHGLEFWVELCNEFGRVTSEYGWTSVLALMQWAREEAGVRDSYAFVDNFYGIHPPGVDAAARIALSNQTFVDMGIEMHETGSGTSCVKQLGWGIDLAANHPRGWTQIMICPLDKYTYYVDRFVKWGQASCLSEKDEMSLCGIVQFLSPAIPDGAAYFPAIRAQRDAGTRKRTKARAQAVFKVKPTKRAFPNAITENVREAILFFSSVLAKWDRMSPLRCGFGPTAGAQRNGWVDAATDEGHGCGGVFYDAENSVLLGFTHVWTTEELDLARSHRNAKRESTGVLETLGIMWWMIFFAGRCSCMRTLLRVDSSPAVLAYRKAFSAKPAMRTPMREARLLAAREYVTLRVEWARTFSFLIKCFLIFSCFDLIV
jgi:hypothetical protein